MLRKTKEGYLFEEFIYCCCGCRKTRPRYDEKGRERRFIASHQRRKEPRTSERARRFNLHVIVRKLLPLPEHCPICRKSWSYYELANITGVYERELNNWSWLCFYCHRLYDSARKGKIAKFHNLNPRGILLPM